MTPTMVVPVLRALGIAMPLPASTWFLRGQSQGLQRVGAADGGSGRGAYRRALSKLKPPMPSWSRSASPVERNAIFQTESETAANCLHLRPKRVSA